MAYCNRTQILIVDTVHWETASQLRYRANTAEFTVCAYSPCGLYLAAGTQAGDVCVWRVRTGEALDVCNKDDAQTQPIVTLAWNPRTADNGGGPAELAYTDDSGQLGTVVYTAGDYGGMLGDEAAEEANANELFDDDGDSNYANGNGNGVHPDADDDDEDNENCVSLERLKNATMRTAQRDDDDDIDAILDRQTDQNVAAASAAAAAALAAPKIVPHQPPFQPAATPAHLEHRYLVWNAVGLVRAHTSDTENSIEVDFHDASVHHSIHMSNYLGHTMASLSRRVLALARDAPSKLVCIALGASSGSREWSTALEDCDEIVALTATDRLVAVATRSRRLHIFSCMGTQREVIGVPGAVVALAGHGDQLCVAYHAQPASASKEQPLAALLVSVLGLSVRCRTVPMALGAGADARLRWLGYTERGSPVAADSLGGVWLFSQRGSYWMPVCQMREQAKNVSDTYWVIDVCEERQLVRAILCRGAAYPVTMPKPIVQDLAMRLPLCDMESEKAQLEEQLLRVAGMEVANGERVMKEVAIKLFAVRVNRCGRCESFENVSFLFSSPVAPKWSRAPAN